MRDTSSRLGATGAVTWCTTERTTERTTECTTECTAKCTTRRTTRPAAADAERQRANLHHLIPLGGLTESKAHMPSREMQIQRALRHLKALEPTASRAAAAAHVVAAPGSTGAAALRRPLARVLLVVGVRAPFRTALLSLALCGGLGRLGLRVDARHVGLLACPPPWRMLVIGNHRAQDEPVLSLARGGVPQHSISERGRLARHVGLLAFDVLRHRQGGAL